MLEILMLFGGIVALLWLYACAMCLLLSLQSFLKACYDRITENAYLRRSQRAARNECPVDGTSRNG